MGFLAPWFFGGLALLSVPVFVHLLRHHVAIPRPVSSLMFFERGIQSSTRHHRLKHLVLLALRCALVLLVVLAFANPFVRRVAANTNGRLLLIVLDNSFSMRAGSRFADAQAAGDCEARRETAIAKGADHLARRSASDTDAAHFGCRTTALRAREHPTRRWPRQLR